MRQTGTLAFLPAPGGLKAKPTAKKTPARAKESRTL